MHTHIFFPDVEALPVDFERRHFLHDPLQQNVLLIVVTAEVKLQKKYIYNSWICLDYFFSIISMFLYILKDMYS